MAGAVEIDQWAEPSVCDWCDLSQLLCAIYLRGEGFTLIFTLNRYGPLGRVWFLGGSTLKWGIIFALVGAVLLVWSLDRIKLLHQLKFKYLNGQVFEEHIACAQTSPPPPPPSVHRLRNTSSFKTELYIEVLGKQSKEDFALPLTF